MREVYDFLLDAGVWFLATAEGAQPRLRPFDSVWIYRDRLYFVTGRAKAVSRELHANPRVELCALRGDDWLRVEGSTVLDDDPAMREDLPPLPCRFDAAEGGVEYWYLRNCSAAFCTGSELIKTWRF